MFGVARTCPARPPRVHARGTRHVLGGIVAAAEAHGIELQPTLFASALPGGVVTRGGWNHLLDREVRYLD